MKTIDLERVRELLAYDPDTGVFTWRVSRSWNAKVLETVPVYTAASPAQTPAKDMRSQFESWAKSYSTLSIDRDLGGAYVDMNQEMLWHAFQAGVKA